MHKYHKTDHITFVKSLPRKNWLAENRDFEKMSERLNKKMYPGRNEKVSSKLVSSDIVPETAAVFPVCRKLVERFSPLTFHTSSPMRWMIFKPLPPIILDTNKTLSSCTPSAPALVCLSFLSGESGSFRSCLWCKTRRLSFWLLRAEARC